MLIAWLNLASLLISTLLCWYFYILSAMPATRAEKYGEKAWQDCRRFRVIAGVFLTILVINMILWVWIPVPDLAWPIHPNPLIPFLLGIFIAIPSLGILVKGLIDAGKETVKPSGETKMYRGIYNYIRHPQLLGRIPLTIMITLWINSLFLLSMAIIFLLILIPILIYFEEKDLVKRYGDAYVEYQQQTGALFPKFWKRKTKRG